MASTNQQGSYKIILKGNPLSTQHCYKHVCRNGKFPSVYMDARCKTMKEDYMWQAKTQWKRKPLTEELSVGIKLYFGDKRKRDWDNYNKLFLDALEGIVYVNDNQIKKALVEVFYDKENPHIEIIINNL